MNRKYNFETPERVVYGGPWVSFWTAIFLFRAATGLGLFEAKTFVEANMDMSDQREVNTRELGEMIKAWWDEKGTPKRLQENKPAQTWLEAALIESKKKQAVLNQSRVQQDKSWEAIGPEDCRSEETIKKEASARQDGWRGIDREDPWLNVMSNPDKPR